MDFLVCQKIDIWRKFEGDQNIWRKVEGDQYLWKHFEESFKEIKTFENIWRKSEGDKNLKTFERKLKEIKTFENIWRKVEGDENIWKHLKESWRRSKHLEKDDSAQVQLHIQHIHKFTVNKILNDCSGPFS